MFVKIIGSRKNPMFPMNLPDTVGIEISQISLIVFLFGIKSSF